LAANAPPFTEGLTRSMTTGDCAAAALASRLPDFLPLRTGWVGVTSTTRTSPGSRFAPVFAFDALRAAPDIGGSTERSKGSVRG
jgi:hypothetical protein